MNILVIYTGGTIGCVGDPLSPMPGPAFEAAFRKHVVPIVDNEYPKDPRCRFEFVSFTPTLDSTNMQPADWCEIAEKVLEHYGRHDAFIVLHGTDSMAWTASALSFLLGGLQPSGLPLATLTKPVIVTGSQLPLFHQQDRTSDSELLFNTDALQNVCGAVASAVAGITEVGLYFNGTLMRGNRAVKTNANEFAAFTSPNYPPLAQAGVQFVQQVQNLLAPALPGRALDEHAPAVLAQVRALKQIITGVNVITFPAFPAWARSPTAPQGALIANVLQASLDQGVTGLILESYGAGNFPSGNPAQANQGAIYRVLKSASDRGVVVVDCTQVLAGNVNATLYAAGSWLGECKVVGANDMSPIAALAKLLVLQGLDHACGFGWPPARVRELMQRSLAGEIVEVDRLASFGPGFLAPGQSLSSLDGSVQLRNDPVHGPTVVLHPGPDDTTAPLLNTRGVQMPGRLHVAHDGTVTFTDRINTVVHAWPAGRPTRACQLALSGERGTHPTLQVLDAATNERVSTLYPPAGGA